MSHFNNDREVNLIEYVPDVLANVDEYKAIMEIETRIKKKQWAYLEQFFNAQFILEADSFGLSLFEKMHGIVPSSVDSIENRRSVVYQLYNTEVPFTRRWFDGALKGMLKNAASYYYNIDTEKLTLTVYFEKLTPSLRRQFEKWLDDVIPYNMGIATWSITPISGEVFCGGHLSMSNRMRIEASNTLSDIELDKNYCCGGVIRLHTVHTLKAR